MIAPLSEPPARPRRGLLRVAWLLGILAGLLAVAAGAAIVTVRLPLPARSGRDRLPGLSAPASVVFDERGVPHVRAATEEDAYRVLGWLHAGDRFFQMELRRRVARGRLAEVLGPALLPLDIDARRAGHSRAAERDLERLSARVRASVEAYVQGVNAYLAVHSRPLELVVLGLDVEPWSAGDSLAFSRFMIEGLSEAPARAIQALLARGVLKSADGASILPGGDRGPAGSNAWAVAGRRTASGKPILANDPHLGVEFPGVWYAAHLSSRDGLDVAGLTVPGIPGVAIGHNGSIAWGITMAQVDDADVDFETIDPARLAYRRDDRWVPLGSRAEKIRVKGQGDRDVVFYTTDRGTLLGAFEEKDGAWKAAVLVFAPERATASLEAFERVGRARDLVELERAWARYGGPAFNVCWASTENHVGVRLAGSIPDRRSAGIVPDEELPRIADPPEGFVATANDDWSAAGRKLPFPGFYADDRIGRIRELLTATKDATPADMNTIQNDVLSPYAVRIVEALPGLVHPDGEARRALDVLLRWDGRAERKGPSRLFYAFLSDLASRRRVEGWSAVEEALLDPEPAWDDPKTAQTETRELVIAASLAASLEKVEREDGEDPASWSWGRAHTLRYEHPFSSRLPFPFLRRFLDVGPIELPGEIHTIDVEGFRLGREPRIRHIPSMRLVVDLGNLDASTLVLPLGQSGQFQDRHYDDQVEAWAEGRTFPFPFTAEAVDHAAVSELRLEP